MNPAMFAVEIFRGIGTSLRRSAESTRTRLASQR